VNDGLSVRVDEALAAHLPIRTGGSCGAWVVAHTLDGLSRVIRECRPVKWPVRMLGSGTRTIARDGEHRGVVLRLGTGFSTITMGEVCHVGAAAPVPALIAAAEAAGLGGLSFLAHVPGSVGASVRLDEGWGAILECVWTLHRGKERQQALADVQRKKCIITRVELRLPPLDRTEAKRLSRARARQPVPPGSAYALRRGDIRQVLRSSALQRVRLRGIVIPSEAPELLVNIGGGSAADFRLLQRSAIERARRVRGIELENRLDWIGGR
jgi:UDP-N-acetylmuramate dehydrogenase